MLKPKDSWTPLIENLIPLSKSLNLNEGFKCNSCVKYTLILNNISMKNIKRVYLAKIL